MVSPSAQEVGGSGQRVSGWIPWVQRELIQPHIQPASYTFLLLPHLFKVTKGTNRSPAKTGAYAALSFLISQGYKPATSADISAPEVLLMQLELCSILHRKEGGHSSWHGVALPHQYAGQTLNLYTSGSQSGGVFFGEMWKCFLDISLPFYFRLPTKRIIRLFKGFP